ncbi:MAG: exosortase/archaeosortase family protein [Flavobacteriales bacterium]|nr:exosortase/archaeosortase family protein [Flavobacteriales bacterium]
MGASTQWVLWYLVALKIEAHQIFSGSGIWYKNNLIVVINESCSGINLYIIFTTLVFAFIKGWGRKLLVSVIGIIYLLLLNDFRAIISVWVKIKSPTYYYFTHEVLFLYLLYGFLVYYWYINFKKHGIKLKTNNE